MKTNKRATKRWLRPLLFASLVCASCLGSKANAGTVSFDSPSDLSAYFITTGTANKFSAFGSGGINNSPDVAIDSAFTTSSLVTDAALQGGQNSPTFTLSIYFQFITPTSNAGGTFLSLGLANSSTFDPSVGGNLTYTDFAITKTAFSTQYSVAIGCDNNGYIPVTNNYSVTFASGNWYYINLQGVWNTSKNYYDMQSQICNANSSGTVGSVISTQNLLFPNYGAGGTTAPLYAYISASGPAQAMGIGTLDSFAFTPVLAPEPSPLGMLSIGTVLIGAAQIRRRKHWPYSKKSRLPFCL